MAFQIHSLFLFTCFVCCVSLCYGDDAVIIDLVNRVEALENEGAEQRQLLQEQRTDLHMLYNVVHQQNTRLSYQTKLTKDFMKRVNVLEMKLAVLQKAEHESKDITKDEHQTEGSLTQPVEQNSKHDTQSLPIYDNESVEPKKEKIRQNRAAETAVAFHAVFKGDGYTDIGPNQIIVFPDVITNLAAGYHNHLGVFIAPKGGVYIFSTTISSGWDTWIDVNIMVNGSRLATASAAGNTASHEGSGTVAVVAQLSAKDEVWVRLSAPTEGSSLREQYQSSFMGCLVYPEYN